MVVVTAPKPGVDPVRFADAARAAASLPHPHIAAILAIEEPVDGGPLVASEFVRGHSLADLLRGSTPVAVIEMLRQVAELCDALAFAHQHGMLHRPFSPSHAILDRAGRMTLVGIGTDGGAVPNPGPAAERLASEVAAAVGRVLHELLALPTRQRPGPDGHRRAPLATLRPDISPAVAAFVDRWVAEPSVVPLARRAGDLRALIESMRQPAPEQAPPGLHAFVAEPVPKQVRVAERHETADGAGLDSFMTEAQLQERADVGGAPERLFPDSVEGLFTPTVRSTAVPPDGVQPVTPSVARALRRPRRTVGRLAAGLAAVAAVGAAAWWWTLETRRSPALSRPRVVDSPKSSAIARPAVAPERALRAVDATPAPSLALAVDEHPPADAPSRPPVQPPPLMVPRPREAREPERLAVVMPEYPEAARGLGVTGDVTVDVTIESDGRVSEVTAISGPVILRGAAQTALRQWRFSPAVLDGAPVSSVRRFVITFAAAPTSADPAAPPTTTPP